MYYTFPFGFPNSFNILVLERIQKLLILSDAVVMGVLI